MPSRAEPRRRLELGARALALLALAALLWRTFRPVAVTSESASLARTADLAAALPVWSARGPRAADLALDSVPGPATRDWLRALAATGTAVRWTESRILGPSTVAVESQAAPGGRLRLTIAAPPGGAVVSRDGAGIVDSVTMAKSGVRTLDATLDGAILVASPGVAARTTAGDSAVLRPVLILARAGWEGKFVAAALEEDGWGVEARFRVAPDVAVRQGAASPVDTARYSAVIALDESAAPWSREIARYAADGGGVVVAPAAVATLRPIVPARLSRESEGRLGGLLTDDPRSGLGHFALDGLSSEAVVLERRGVPPAAGGRAGSPVLAAARHGLGRVLVVGYADTWRWRMSGGDAAASEHRRWWSGLVSSVAYAPRLAVPTTAPADPSPYASLVASLGPPADGVPRRGPARPDARAGWWTPVLFALFLTALLAEWTSRRTRGAR